MKELVFLFRDPLSIGKVWLRSAAVGLAVLLALSSVLQASVSEVVEMFVRHSSKLNQLPFGPVFTSLALVLLGCILRWLVCEG